MSKVETLKASVLKAEEKVEKCKATIERHKKALEKKLAKLSSFGVTLENLEAMKDVGRQNGGDIYWEICEIEWKLKDIEGATKKLKEAEAILANWNEKLEKEVGKEATIKNEVPEVIKTFLENWKKMAYDWHLKRYADFQVYSRKLDEEVKKAEAELGILPHREKRKALEEKGLDYKSVQAKKANFAGGAVIHMCTIRNEKERLAWLNKSLEEEKKAKTLDLLNRVNHVVGKITDAKGLRVSEKGNLDGIIVGTKGKAKIETIGAGGWNIQCFHYRILVHKVK